MFTHSIFWLWFAGLFVLIAGVVVVREDFLASRGLARLIVLGPVFVAAPLAVFAAEHFVDVHDIAQIVPGFMPWHLFWTYFVGCALLAAAVSFVAMKFVRLSATLLGVMFFLFVLMMDLPGAIADPGNRLGWNFVLRESAFAGGAWALAGAQTEKQNWMIQIGHVCVALAVIYFGIEQVLHPDFLPGVPDTKLTPAWVPLHALWGYPVGAFLLVAGIVLLINKRPRLAAASVGALMTVLTVGLYLPILAVTHDPSQMTEAINFVFDTLLFAGTALNIAYAQMLQG